MLCAKVIEPMFTPSGRQIVVESSTTTIKTVIVVWRTAGGQDDPSIWVDGRNENPDVLDRSADLQSE